jgi:uncharacterized protein YcbK (DUF882 family)
MARFLAKRSFPRHGGTMRALATFGVLVSLFATSSPASAGEIAHVVAKGQTLGQIAKRYGTTVAVLREANDLKPGQRLHPGALLVVPDEKVGGKRGDKREGSRGARTAPADRRSGRSGSSASAPTFVAKPKHPGLVRLARGSEKAEIQVLTRKGALVPASLAAVSRALRFYPTDSRIAIDPRLATLLGMVSDHFGGRPLQVVSGFRPYSPDQYTPHSNHNAGRAVDFRIEGVPNTVLRDYCRNFRNAGVGYYPNSTFVHLDVRSLSAYWIDYSRAGERPRYDPAHDHHAADETVAEVEAGSTKTRGFENALQNNSENSDDVDPAREKSEEPGIRIPGMGRLQQHHTH